jgi:hypothetical protein
MEVKDEETARNDRKTDVFLAFLVLALGIILWVIWPPLVLISIILGVPLLFLPPQEIKK